MQRSQERTPLRLFALIFLALAGIGFSIYLAKHFYDVQSGAAGFKSGCNFGSKMNCDTVAASRYAAPFGGIPLASFAAGGYLALLGVYCMSLMRGGRAEAIRIAFVMTGFAVLASLFYFYLMAGRIGTFCLYCLLIDVVNVLSFGIVLTLKPERPSERPINSSQWKTAGIISVLAFFVAIVGLKGLDQMDVKAADLDLMAQSILSEAPTSVNSGPEYPSIGPKDASITIVEFSDFQCPYCRMGAVTLNSLMARYQGKLRVVMRQFPFDMACNRIVTHPMHEHSCEAANVGLCANQQGKFHEAYEALFENQEKLESGVKAAEIVKDSGVDNAALAQCMTSKQVEPKIQADIEEGLRLDINSTPTFFINGLKVRGMIPIQVWDIVIDSLLAKK